MPAFNAERFLGQTLRSLLQQTYPRLEIVVVDDGSTDATAEIAASLARQHHRIRLIRQPNAGVAAARNVGIQSASGEFIAPVDADDIWFPEAAAKLVERLRRPDSRVDVAYAWAVTMDQFGHVDGGHCSSRVQGNVYRTLLCHNFLGNASSSMIRRSELDRIGGYDPQFRQLKAQGCEDWDLYLRLAERCRFGVVPEFLVAYRRAGGSMSSNASTMAKSHQQLLTKVRMRSKSLPPHLHRLSTSSFYLHLARECQRRNLRHEAHHWWKEAAFRGRAFTLVRPAWYDIGLANGLSRLRPRRARLTAQPTGQSNATALDASPHRRQERVPPTDNTPTRLATVTGAGEKTAKQDGLTDGPISPPACPHRHTLHFRMRLLLQDVLHRILDGRS